MENLIMVVTKYSTYDHSMPRDDLSAAQAAIVAVLREGRATTGYLAEEIDYSSAHINTQLRVLVATDTIRLVHEPTALYELNDDTQQSATTTAIVTDDTLSSPEAAIVEVLRDGRATTGYLTENVDYSSSHISTQLRVLLAKGIIRNVHSPTALYELTDNTRENSD